MKNFKLKSMLLISLLVASAPAITDAEEPYLLSDRLALNTNIDPTTVFLNIASDFTHRDEMVSDILDYAKSFLGRPYLRGSKGPKAFDCSGFTSYVFKNFDIFLSASSSSQYGQGQGIDITEVRPGDLLFFGGSRGSTKRVGHVALAVDVDDNGTVTFIHASTGGGIRYDKYPDGGYYSRRYIGARRVIE